MPALDKPNTAIKISIIVVVLGAQPLPPHCSALAQSKAKRAVALH